MIVVVPLSDDTLTAVIEQLIADTLGVWWTTGPDYENMTARTMARALTSNPDDVAAMIVDRHGLAYKVAPFLHQADKKTVVLRIEEHRLNKDRGSW